MALFAVRFLPLKTSLSNLPPTLYSPLVASQKVSCLARRISDLPSFIPLSCPARADYSSPDSRPVVMQRPQSLAVHVRTQAGSESYVGWSGLSSSRPAPGSGQKEYLEVDPGVGRAMGWQEGELVSLPHVSLSREVDG